ncbi:MAG: hypothetical protein BWY66_00387 [bacterium ADurb.Bin374]|nr:MAG: hypothetical protein BWY66_00387 [bacterium ADurb.Bin374]
MKLDGKTTEELLAMIREIEDDPANRQSTGLYLYTEKARKKTDKIARAIAALAAEKRRLAGDPVPCNGYSGRKSNRRR